MAARGGAAAAAPSPAQGGPGTSMDGQARIFMPFAYTQRLTDPLQCDGALVMYELSAAVFQCGSRGWNDLLMLPERIRLVKLFVFLLQCACECNAIVAIETVVDGHDHVEQHGGNLNNRSVVTGYRLWIPLDAAQEVAFLYAVSAAVSPAEAVGEHMGSRDFSWYKRRRVESTTDYPTFPEYARPIGSVTELTELVRLYFMGTRKIDMVVGAETTTVGPGMAPETDPATLTRLLSAGDQFTGTDFTDRGEYHGTWEMQMDYDQYITTIHESHARAFYPSDAIRNLTRVFRCGAEGAFLRAGTDIFRYLLPPQQPTLRQLRTQLENVFAARGTVRSFSGVELDDLVSISIANNTALCQDPHSYAPVKVDRDEDLVDCADSFYSTAMIRQYFIMATLHERNSGRRRFAANRGDSDTVARIYSTVDRDVTMMLSAPSIKGCPPVYNDLKGVSDALMEFMHTPPKTLADQTAQHFFKTPPTDLEQYRGLSGVLTRLTVGAKNNLGLRDHQHSVWLLLYLRHFSVTLNRMGESFFGVLTGPPESGKSRACEMFATSIPSKLVMQVDGSSALAMTTYGPEHDLRVVLVDELKNVNDKFAAGANDIQTKLIQSQISNGCITYNTKVHDTVNGGFKLERVVVVLRNATVTCTNFVGYMAPALKSRATTFAVPSTKASRKKGKHVSRMASVVGRDQAYNTGQRQSWSKCLQTYSALQWRYTAFEAAGLIDSMDDTLLSVFFYMLFDEFGDAIMSRRRIISLKQFAVAIRIFDLITTWYTRQLGTKYPENPEAELLFYASGSYLTAECVVAAYGLLEQTTSTTVQLNKLLGYLKETILIVDDAPETDGEYYVSREGRQDKLLKHLKKFMKDEGDGVVDALFGVVDAGITEDGLPKMKIEKVGANDRYYLHRSWMAAHHTECEKAILRVLRGLHKKGELCAPQFEREETHVVFEAPVLLSLYEVENTKHPIRHAELDKKTKSQIKQALSFLQDIRDSEGKPAFAQESWANIASYGAAPDAPGSVESKLQEGEYMVARDLFNVLVVSLELLEERGTSASLMDDFFIKYLTVAGGYDDGRRVYAGVDSLNTHRHIPDHTVRVPPGHHVNVTIPNDSFRSDACDRMMFGDVDTEETMHLMEETASDKDILLHNTIFPPDKELIEFTEASQLEAMVAERAIERICVPVHYRADFLEARAKR